MLGKTFRLFVNQKVPDWERSGGKKNFLPQTLNSSFLLSFHCLLFTDH
ncbi:hypothetical protein MYAER_1415 [Microcystis aeruginosa NIES-2549]|uniref:Uncharacterized protein n=1 Tax=Microcystis aeruginosa NIES-2549 TaxID=1641812 RepID=A0A0F6U375_MICAE|nr:hypothetical protein MYAER_1415 [Microcystis aeruginosa NIES-2549]